MQHTRRFYFGVAFLLSIFSMVFGFVMALVSFVQCIVAIDNRVVPMDYSWVGIIFLFLLIGIVSLNAVSAISRELEE